MADRRGLSQRLHEAERRLDDQLSHLRQATIRAAQVTFGPVDLTAAGDGEQTRLDTKREFGRRLSDLTDEWHEDNGWAVQMPDHVRADFVARVKSSIDEDISKGRL